jgi:hypothetical protein
MKRLSVRVLFAEELAGQDSPVLAVMEYYDAEMTREEYVKTNYLGEVGPVVPAAVEATFPEQFRLATLVETLLRPHCWVRIPKNAPVLVLTM